MLCERYQNAIAADLTFTIPTWSASTIRQDQRGIAVYTLLLTLTLHLRNYGSQRELVTITVNLYYSHASAGQEKSNWSF